MFHLFRLLPQVIDGLIDYIRHDIFKVGITQFGMKGQEYVWHLILDKGLQFGRVKRLEFLEGFLA